jgi:PAS domain S-box-containing protein
MIGNSFDLELLRKSAEAALAQKRKTQAQEPLSEKLLHELHVNQIELEMQNEQLRQTQIALEESRDRYIDLYEFAPVGYLTLGKNGLITEINHTAAGLFGIERNKLLQRSFAGLVAPEDADRWYLQFRRVLNKGNINSCELALKRADGTVVPARLDFNLDHIGDQTSLRISLVDLSERRQLEDSLRAREELRLFIDNAPIALAMLDKDMRHVAVSRCWLENFALMGREIIGKSHYEIFPKIPEDWKDVHRRCLAGETIRADEDRFERIDGSIQWVRWEVLPWYSGEGSVGGIIIFSEDITRYKISDDEIHRHNFALEQRIQESEERYRTLYGSMDEGYSAVEMLYDTTGIPVDYRFIEVNSAFEKQTGLQNALGKTIREMVPNHDAHWFEIFGHVARTGEAIDLENISLGMKQYYNVYIFRIGETGSNKVGVLFRDITKRKQAEEAVKKSEANLQAMLDTSPYMTWMKDSSARYIKINKVFAEYLRLEDANQVVGKTDFDFHPEALAEKYLADEVEVMVEREIKHVEEMRFDGEKHHWVESFKTPVIDKQGNVLGTVGFAQDITQRKLVEAELRISAVAFETQQAMIITDPNGVILRVNKAFIESTGYSAEEAVGNKTRMLHSERHDAEFYRAMWETILRTGAWQGEIWDRRKNGEIYPTWLTVSAVRGNDGAVTNYVGSHFDITERKAAEDKIRNLAFFDHLTRLPNRRLLIMVDPSVKTIMHRV